MLRFPPFGGVKTIFDVGANVGQTALEFSHYFPDSEIHCFEHASKTFDELRKNVASFKNIHAHCTALGPEKGTVKLKLQSQSTNNSLNPIVQEGRAEHTQWTGDTEDVSMTTLDSFCEENKIANIDLLKVDAGGFDIRILEGAEGLFSENRISLVFVEMTLDPRNQVHCQFSELISFFSTRNLVPVAIYDQCVASDLSRNYYANALFSKMS